jgi:hypothetical protein
LALFKTGKSVDTFGDKGFIAAKCDYQAEERRGMHKPNTRPAIADDFHSLCGHWVNLSNSRRR